MNTPRLIKTFLLDGTLEGIKIIEVSESAVMAFVIPRIKLSDSKNRTELQQPALYLLINSGENQIYIGESENFLHRVKNHDQAKDFWDVAVAIVSSTNNLEKSDIKYLESLAVEKSQKTAAVEILNKTVPTRNTMHEFKIHSLHLILEDVALIAESLGYSIFSSKQEKVEEYWYCITKNTHAKAQFRGDKFVILAGSIIDANYSPGWAKSWPESLTERHEIFKRFGTDRLGVFELTDNVSFKSPNHAGGFAAGRNVNAWTTWKDAKGLTMDEVMRKGQK